MELSFNQPHRACLGGSRAFALRGVVQVINVVQKPKSTEASSVGFVIIASLRNNTTRKRVTRSEDHSLARRACLRIQSSFCFAHDSFGLIG